MTVIAKQKILDIFKAHFLIDPDVGLSASLDRAVGAVVEETGQSADTVVEVLEQELAREERERHG